MLSSRIRRITLLLVISFLLCESGFAQSDKVEPVAVYRLLVNGKPIQVPLGREFELDTKGESTLKMKLLASPTRRFTYAGLDFPYPVHFAFETEFEPGSKIWTMEGADVTLMVFDFPKSVASHKAFAREITSEWEGTTLLPMSLKVPGMKLSGTKATSLVAGFEIHQVVFSIPSKRGSRLMMVQDGLDDEGNPSNEYKKVIAMLTTNFRATER